MVRKTEQVEVKMVSQYLLENYAQFRYTMNVPLGKLPNELLEKEGYARTMAVYRPYRPAVDAVVFLPRHFLLVEAKVWNYLNGLSKLPFYKSLVPFTPELQQYMPREVLMQLVVNYASPNLEIMARDAGVELRVVAYDWLKEVRERMSNYWTGEYRLKREQKLQMRDYFGVE